MNGIVLCGFMGTGKSTVARVLGQRLGLEVIDLDARLEARLGASVAEIFARDGEDTFRAAEAELCRELGASAPRAIVATGGGAVLDADNRRHLARIGPLVCLRARVDTLMARLGAEPDLRPLLRGSDAEVRLTSLLEARHPIYAALPVQIETDDRTPDAVADAVLAAIGHFLPARRPLVPGALTLPVELPAQESHYEVRVGAGLLGHLGELVRGAGVRPGRVALVTNPTVGRHWRAVAEAALEAADFEPLTCEVPDGERFKTLETVSTLYERFVDGRLDRSSAVVALGGGVVGDVAGFAAATFMRGLPIVQVPTSLLAMVDASVGGKTGVDLPAGKNLVGAFAQPRVVVVDPDVLATLAPEEFRSGLAEVVKHAIIDGPEMFESLEQCPPTAATGVSAELLAEAIEVKIGIVEADPFEVGRRAVLNLGHTFAHAIERVSGYAVRHGEAVAVGLVLAARLGVALGRCDEALVERISALLTAVGLPLSWSGASPQALLDAMGTDKKAVASRLRFIVPEALGRVAIVDRVDPAVVLDVLGGG